MRSYYHRKGFRLGKASEVKSMITEDNPNLEILTVPISLRFPYIYTLKNFRVRVISDSLPQESELYTVIGNCFGEGIGMVFTLDWDNRMGYIAIAHLEGRNVMIGPPIMAKPIGREGKYRVTVEIYRNANILASKSYILFYQDSLQLLEDDTQKNG